ncbi:MAG: membrane dipeptidase [Oscillospiraceae bacterium]|nr:membrane dipeptidase [Oscillospiraceae bacterium]
MISYFDAHCDTIHRCAIRPEDTVGMPEDFRRYFADVESLRSNKGHVDLLRGGQFRRYAQFFALYHDPFYPPPDGLWAQCLRMHECFLREMADNADLVRHCCTAADVNAAVEDGRTAALLSVEGADLLDCDSRRIDIVADWGVRLFNPVWNHPNILCGTNKHDTGRGLSQKGREFIRRLEERGIYADVSHISDPGFWDLVGMARRPVVASHSNSRALCNHPRNLTDDMFRAIRDSGGVVGINLYSGFVGEAGSMEELTAHVEHFLELGGEKTLCIGGDLDGCESLAAGMRGVQDVPQLCEALAKRGFGEELLEDIFWNNLMRIL